MILSFCFGLYRYTENSRLACVKIGGCYDRKTLGMDTVYPAIDLFLKNVIG